jgi:hypothetical protein
MPIQIQAKQDRPFGCFSEQLLKNLKLKIRPSWVLLDCPGPTRPGRQAIGSDFLITISIPHHIPGGGVPQKGGGFSGSNEKPDTDGIPHLTISYTSQGFQNNISD